MLDKQSKRRSKPSSERKEIERALQFRDYFLLRQKLVGIIRISITKAIGKLLQRLDLSESAGENEIWRDRKLSNGNCPIFTDLKTEKWKYAKKSNKMERKLTNEEQRELGL
jgi:hypothetical protein